MASPTGCSLPVSAAATRARTSSSAQPPTVVIPVSAGVPRVIVPVLSRTTAVTRRAVSSASPLPMRMPSSAARPVPTMTAVGVASPSAHGQAMMSTAMVVVIAMVSQPVSGPSSAQATKVAAARPSTSGTNQAETRSARRCMRHLRALRVLDQADDLRQRGVRADGGGPQHEAAGAVERGADDAVAGGLVHRQALAGQHALVHRGRAVGDDAVDRDLLTGPDPHQVTDDDVLDRDVHLDAVAQHPRGLRAPGRRGR